MTISTVRLYSRPGCHLCETVAELLEQIARECPIDLEEIDITTDIDLFDRYRYEIPVVAVEGGGSVAGKIKIEDLRRILHLMAPRGDTDAAPVEVPIEPADPSAPHQG